MNDLGSRLPEQIIQLVVGELMRPHVIFIVLGLFSIHFYMTCPAIGSAPFLKMYSLLIK